MQRQNEAMEKKKEAIVNSIIKKNTFIITTKESSMKSQPSKKDKKSINNISNIQQKIAERRNFTKNLQIKP